MALRKLGENYYSVDTLIDVLHHVEKRRREQAKLDKQALAIARSNNQPSMFDMETTTKGKENV